MRTEVVAEVQRRVNTEEDPFLAVVRREWEVLVGLQLEAEPSLHVGLQVLSLAIFLEDLLIVEDDWVPNLLYIFRRHLLDVESEVSSSYMFILSHSPLLFLKYTA